jgi:hypothetical protein
VKRLTFEIDTEPYAKIRDDEISNLAEKNGIEVVRKTSHTLFSPNAIVQVNVESEINYRTIVKRANSRTDRIVIQLQITQKLFK